MSVLFLFNLHTTHFLLFNLLVVVVGTLLGKYLDSSLNGPKFLVGLPLLGVYTVLYFSTICLIRSS